jgi:hypothetical protein
MNAERRAKAVAWEWEKEQAQLNKACSSGRPSWSLACAWILRLLWHAYASAAAWKVLGGASSTAPPLRLPPQGRAQRLKWRTEDARLQHQAAVLRRFWQTHAGFTPGDALVLGLFLVGAAGIALTWRSHLQWVRQRHQHARSHDQQEQHDPRQQLVQQPVKPPQPQHLPPAAAVATMPQPP